MAIEDDATATTQAFQARVQCVYAVRPGADGLLDLARQLFTETTEQVHETVAKYRAEYELRTLKMPYNQKRGFFITVSAKEMRSFQARAAKGDDDDETLTDGAEDAAATATATETAAATAAARATAGPLVVPSVFINSTTKNGVVTCTTHELLGLNERNNEAAEGASE